MDHCSSDCCWSTFSTACLPLCQPCCSWRRRSSLRSFHTQLHRAGATRGKLQLCCCCCCCHHHHHLYLSLLFYGADMRRSRRHNFHQYQQSGGCGDVPSASTYTASQQYFPCLPEEYSLSLSLSLSLSNSLSESVLCACAGTVFLVLLSLLFSISPS